MPLGLTCLLCPLLNPRWKAWAPETPQTPQKLSLPWNAHSVTGMVLESMAESQPHYCYIGYHLAWGLFLSCESIVPSSKLRAACIFWRKDDIELLKLRGACAYGLHGTAVASGKMTHFGLLAWEDWAWPMRIASSNSLESGGICIISIMASILSIMGPSWSPHPIDHGTILITACCLR